ncbi:MAG: DUF3352 domain-containing protein, partial [Thermoplasmata archaeon]|nr:DUF3352 domain-containing protein [Thermoplasmata archaeon]
LDTMKLAAFSEGRLYASFFLDLKGLMTLLETMSALGVDVRSVVTGLEETKPVWRRVGATLNVGRGVMMRVATVFDREEADALVRLELETRPRAGRNISMIPADALFYVGLNSNPDLVKAWELQGAQFERGSGWAALRSEIIDEIEKTLEVSITEDVIPFVGREIALVVTDIDTSPGFPYPKLSLMIEVKDRAKAEVFMEKLVGALEERTKTGALKLEFISRNYRGKKIWMAKLPLPLPIPGFALTPGYAFVDDFLVLSLSADELKKMIDTQAEGSGIRRNPLFQDIGFPTETNSLVFINGSRAVEAIRSVVMWSVSMAETAGAPEEANRVINQYIIPLIGCLDAIESVGIYEIIAADYVQETYIIRGEETGLSTEQVARYAR